MKVYVETTVLSYFTSRASRDLVIAAHQQTTREFWSRLDVDFQPLISALVVREAQCGDAEAAQRRMAAIQDFAVLPTTHQAEALASKLVECGGVPAQYPEDALHIAIATHGGVDFLVTWNFAHINNPFRRQTIRSIVESTGYACPEIVSPEELLGEAS